MTQPDHELSDGERRDLYARRKKEVWHVVLVMTITTCAGSAILIYVLWLIFQKFLP